MIASCDIETCCNVPECPDYNKSHCKEGHSLHHLLNRITIIGVYDGKDYYNFGDDVEAFDLCVAKKKLELIFHGGKFDYKVLKAKGSKITPKHYFGDTLLLSHAITKNVPETFLKEYNERRLILNLDKGSKHRMGTPHSLKVLAPYFIKVQPFWETEDHNDNEYNKKDCVYTFDLYTVLERISISDDTNTYYRTYLLPWNKLLIEAELEGVLIDVPLLHKMHKEAQEALAEIEEKMHEELEQCYASYLETIILKLEQDSEARFNDYISKRDNVDMEKTKERYAASLIKKIEKLPKRFNLASPKQMLYILTYFCIDTSISKRNKEDNTYEDSEGTNKLVLKRAKVIEENKFAARLLDYREKQTEVRYLEQYIKQTVGDRIYCSFSITGTRTGRLSSSGPNLQNIKGALRAPFIIADFSKYSIYTVDSSQIEPRVIAYLTCDQAMVKLFQDGRDYHNYATHLFFPETRTTPENDIKKVHKDLRNNVAKHGDLSILYGTGPETLATMCLVRGERHIELSKAKAWVKEFKDGMSGVLSWKRGLEGYYAKGGEIRDKFGAVVTARDKRSTHMTLFNSLSQGTASKMIFNASLMAQREFWRLRIDAKPLSWVHDEVIWRFPKGREEECQKIVDHYMTCYKLQTPYGRVPLAVEGQLADRWTK